MPTVKWPIPIIGKLADNRSIIGAPLLSSTAEQQQIEQNTLA